MIHFRTESGAEYLVDGSRIQRLSGPFSPYIDYAHVPDAEWHDVLWISDIEVGRPVRIYLAQGVSRWTTAVSEIEEWSGDAA